jgi:hypothetical protein
MKLKSTQCENQLVIEYRFSSSKKQSGGIRRNVLTIIILPEPLKLISTRLKGSLFYFFFFVFPRAKFPIFPFLTLQKKGWEITTLFQSRLNFNQKNNKTQRFFYFFILALCSLIKQLLSLIQDYQKQQQKRSRVIVDMQWQGLCCHQEYSSGA